MAVMMIVWLAYSLATTPVKLPFTDGASHFITVAARSNLVNYHATDSYN